MIQQVEHTATGIGPADLALALEVAGTLHTPTPTAPSRAPEVATTRVSAGRRATAARSRRRTVRG